MTGSRRHRLHGPREEGSQRGGSGWVRDVGAACPGTAPHAPRALTGAGSTRTALSGTRACSDREPAPPQPRQGPARPGTAPRAPHHPPVGPGETPPAGSVSARACSHRVGRGRSSAAPGTCARCRPRGRGRPSVMCEGDAAPGGEAEPLRMARQPSCSAACRALSRQK